MIYGKWYEYTTGEMDGIYQKRAWGIRVAGEEDLTGQTVTVVKRSGDSETVILTGCVKDDDIGPGIAKIYTFKRVSTSVPEAPVDMENLKPMLWNRPDKEYHGKPIYADHWFRKGKHQQYEALPKEARRAKMYRCVHCNQQVAVAKSPKTGKMIVCKVEQVQHTYKKYRGGKTYRTAPEVYFYPFVPHQCEGGRA